MVRRKVTGIALDDILINLPDTFISGAKSATSQGEIDKHLELGRDYLARGQLTDALTHYHAAVGEFDGQNQQIIELWLDEWT